MRFLSGLAASSSAAFPKRLGDCREGRSHALGERLLALGRPQAIGAREGPLELVAGSRVGEIFQVELMRLADAVGPVGADPEPQHVGDDQQRGVLQRQRVLPELLEGGVEVRALSLVFPGEVVALPDVGPAVAARILAGEPRAKQYVSPDGSASAGVGSLTSRQVDEVLLRRRAFLQRGDAPRFDEVVRGHGCPIDIRRGGCRASRPGRAVSRSECRKSRDSFRPDSAIVHRANR